MTALDTLTQANVILDRWEHEATPLPWRDESGWIQASNEEYVMEPVGDPVSHINVRLTVAAVSVLLGDNPGSVRSIIRDAIAEYSEALERNDPHWFEKPILLSNLIIELDKERS